MFSNGMSESYYDYMQDYSNKYECGLVMPLVARAYDGVSVCLSCSVSNS